ncbi:MAG: helix-turn-helix transcriptional regulator, partial [Verrucomicrobiae bacterium]|nr:helix-turn-helix transcriptional regulator [Verrucomicrobiae bacterium]
AEALHLIKNQACEGITVDEIVKQVHVSRSILERRFRKHIGRSPQVEIRTVQIQKVKQLLRETNYTLSHIAELVGFEHPEYLSVVFKKLVKITPNQYRKKAAVTY